MISDSCNKLSLLLLSVTFYYFLLVPVFAQSVEAVIAQQPTVAVSTGGQQPKPTTGQTSSGSQVVSIANPKAPYPGCVEQLFKISGYYSPKPDQQVYTRDTYEAELKLNGRGVHGASGLPVFNGMVAAPKSYAFGTVIVLPGLGIGQVQDRGGAIVNSDGYDRIDIRVGHGDDGIHRAKSIGLRWVVGRYCPGSVTKDIGFERENIPWYTDFVSVAFWSIDQNIGRSGPLVTKLQSYLKGIGYMTNDTIPGVYNQQMRELICRFQIEQLGLGGSEDYCGVLGPQTRATLKKMLIKQGIISDKSLYQLSNYDSISSLFTQPNIRPAWNYQTEPLKATTTGSTNQLASSQTTVNLQSIKATFTTPMELGDESNDVVVLQKILAREKLFDRSATGYFGPITKAALAQFQLKYKLIDSLNHPAAGYIGPSTRALLLKKQVVLRFK